MLKGLKRLGYCLVLAVFIILAVVVSLSREGGRPNAALPAEAQLYYEQYVRPLAELMAETPALQPADLAELTAALPRGDFVVFTVDGWPVWFSELAYRLRIQETISPDSPTYLAARAESPLEDCFNALVEQAVCLSRAQALGLLAEPDEVTEYREKVLDLRAQLYDDADDLSEARLWQQLGITEEQYWQICEFYREYYFVSSEKLYLTLRAEARAQGLEASARAYSWLQVLIWKENAAFELLTSEPLLQFQPDLTQFFSTNLFSGIDNHFK